MNIMRIGLDLAKNIFEVFGVDAQEKEVQHKTLDKRQWLEKTIIQEILNRSIYPNGPPNILNEAEQVIQEQQSKGYWLEQ